MSSAGHLAHLIRGRTRIWLVGLVVGALPVVGAAFPPLAHDTLGRLVPPPDLPVALVRVTTTPERAVQVARDVGADHVWAALPEGDPRLGGAEADPNTLHAGFDGRIRYADDQRLPLPEALGGLLQVDDVQLGHGVRLDGREVVLVWADPATGRREVVGGETGPVDRGALLAIARGCELADAELVVLPLPLTALVTGALAVAAGLVARRLMPMRAMALAGIAALAAAVGCVAARALRVDLPVLSLAAAALVPAGVRLSASVEAALTLLDRLVAWMGPPTRSLELRSDLQARAKLLAEWLPGVTIQALDEPRAAEPGEHVEPVYDRGAPIGALRFELSEDVPPDAEALTRMIARGLPAATPPPPDSEADDPFAVRIALARAAVRDALRRSHQWEAIFADTGGVVGLFDTSGALVTGTPRLTARMAPGDAPPLHRALSALTPRGGLDAAREVLVTGRSVRVPAFGGDMVILPVGTPHERTGLVLHLLESSSDVLPQLLETKPLARIAASEG